MKAIEIMNGKFGSKKLKEPYMRYWKFATYGLAFVIGAALFLAFLQAWSHAVEFIDYVIRG